MQVRHIGLVFVVILILMVAFSKPERVYDERFHFSTYEMFRASGLTLSFFRQESLSATGPGFLCMHRILEPLTQLRMPLVRMVNVFLLLILLVLTMLLFRTLNLRNPGATAMMIIGAPTIIMASGLAHTEMCAAVPFYGFLLFACMAHKPSTSRLMETGLAVAAGLCLALAVSTRQVIAVTAFTPLILSRFRKKLSVISAFILAFIPIPIALFLAWGGVTPPGQNVGGINPVHGILAFAYAGMFALIWDLAWVKWAQGWFFAFVTGMVFMMIFPVTPYVPWESMVSRFLSERAMLIFGYMISRLWVIYGFYHLIWLIKRFRLADNQPETQFLFANALLMLLSASFITHIFSGRYVTSVVPLLVFIHNPDQLQSKGLCLRMVIAALLGLAVTAQYIIL